MNADILSICRKKSLFLPCNPKFNSFIFQKMSTRQAFSTMTVIQSRPDDLQSTPLKGTKLPLFLTARLYFHSRVEIQRSTSSGKPEIVHCQGIASFQTLGFGGLEQHVSEHSLRNLTQELQTTANLFFLCIRVILTYKSLHVKATV